MTPLVDPRSFDLAEYFLPMDASEQRKWELAEVIQTTVEDWLMRSERNANAALIAAAPDLLLALKCMEEEISDYMRINNLGDPGEKHNIRIARAAIARAEGPLASWDQ